MNRPPDSFVLVDEERLLTFADRCFRAAGLDPEHAALLSRLLVNSDLRGVRSHGTRLVDHYTQGLAEGKLNPSPEIRVVEETPGAVVLDGDGALGYLPTMRATELAIERARRLGVGLGLVRHIGHYGSAGHYTRRCAEAGCIGFSVQGYRGMGDASDRSEPPQLAYIGNPPICFAFPGGAEPGVVMDAATCILADYQRGEEFDRLLEVIPAAFFKSVGYTASAELLGGALTGFTLPRGDEIEGRWPQARHGGMVLAIHIGSVLPEPVFRAESDRFVRDVRRTYRPLPGYDRALLPGAIEEERMAQGRREGIRYGPMEQEAAVRAAARWSVPLPWDAS